MHRQGGFGVARLVVVLVLAALGLTGMLTASERNSGGAGVSTKPRPSSPRSHAKRGASSTNPIPLPGSPSKLLGQRIMVGFSGSSPSAALVSSVRRGEVGSVILFASNLESRSQTLALTGALQRAARAGGNPRLLITTDQEGGQVKRLPAGPPDRSPPQMEATGNLTTASGQGRATAALLRRWGINVDLAPVADVPTSSAAFIWRQGRAFSFNASTVAKYAAAFALGLQSRRVAATGKHFPGLGSAISDTDFTRDELHPTAAQRAAALEPYKSMIPRGLDIVMLSVAGYPAYDSSGAAAALSRPIIAGLLRGQLRFSGVTMTDALGTTTGHDELTAGVLAAAAGADILLFTDSAPGELRRLRTALADGQITRAQAAASYRRIVTLKRRLGLD